MKIAHRLTLLMFTASLLTLGACTSTPTRESTGEFIDDSSITTKVKATLLNEASLKSMEINVETFKGVVQLSGFVSSSANIDKAVSLTRGVSGVRSVKNDMRLK